MSQFPPRAFIRMAADLNRAEPHQSRPTEFAPPAADRTQFLSLRDVLDRLTISRSLLCELIKDRILPFPAPVHIGRRSVWVEDEVERYMQRVLQMARQ